ncbi:hypothetical protein EJ08DRAFT_726947 [Tothia fuscella]|uniref:Uncharacterized protein n=1 Tax=Tothia fuscella TaxID=1048955 RepID=A0A9P4NZ04_9PEZI|nr:hypothetical protein EJ08DRAFT_726947 [Tothia fuscella]
MEKKPPAGPKARRLPLSQAHLGPKFPPKEFSLTSPATWSTSESTIQDNSAASAGSVDKSRRKRNLSEAGPKLRRLSLSRAPLEWKYPPQKSPSLPDSSAELTSGQCIPDSPATPASSLDSSRSDLEYQNEIQEFESAVQPTTPLPSANTYRLCKTAWLFHTPNAVVHMCRRYMIVLKKFNKFMTCAIVTLHSPRGIDQCGEEMKAEHMAIVSNSGVNPKASPSVLQLDEVTPTTSRCKRTFKSKTSYFKRQENILKLQETIFEAAGKHIEHAGDPIELAEDHIEHAGDHIETAGGQIDPCTIQTGNDERFEPYQLLLDIEFLVTMILKPFWT